MILSLVFITSVSASLHGPVGKCQKAENCYGKCPFGVVEICSGGYCYCSYAQEEKAAVPPLAPQRCVTVCDCERLCSPSAGSPVCYKHVCGCLAHPTYKPPHCTRN